MVTQAMLIVMACTAIASPVSPQIACPATSLSKGFKLIINVTDITKDFKDSPVHGMQLSEIHIGAGLNAPIPLQNGSNFFSSGNGTIRLESTASSPYAIDMSDQPEEGDPTLYDLGVNIGTGTKGFSVSSEQAHHRRCPALQAPRTGTFAVCDQGFEAYAHPKQVLKFVEGRQGDWYLAEHMPENCTAIRLLPQCTDLPGLDNGTYEVIPDSQCYVDPVAIVDWSKYSACR